MKNSKEAADRLSYAIQILLKSRVTYHERQYALQMLREVRRYLDGLG